MSAPMLMTFLITAVGAVVLVFLFLKLKARLELSLAKHRSLTGHARMARRVASLIPFYDYDEDRFFRSGDAPDDVAGRRQDSLTRLSQLWGQRFGQTIATTRQAAEGISDLQFTAAYRVPFQFSRVMRH